MTRRFVGAGASLACFMVAAPSLTWAAGICPSMLPNCPSSVTGKEGKLIDHPPAPPKRSEKIASDAAGATGAQKDLGQLGLNRGDLSSAVLHMPQTEKSIQGLINQIKSKWPGANPGPIAVHMRGVTNYAAQAYPDHTMVVTVGLIDRATTDDELAWVLGHETSHILLDHFALNQSTIDRRKAIEQVGQLVILGSALSQQRLQRSGDNIQLVTADQKKVDRDANIALAKSQALREILDSAGFVFTRDQEDQADALGIDLAFLSNYAADEGAAQAFAVLTKDEAALRTQQKTLQEDVTRLTKEALTSKSTLDKFSAGNWLGGLADGAKTAAGGFLKNLSNRAIGFVNQDHRGAEVRTKSIRGYVKLAYNDSQPLPNPSKTLLTKIRATTEFKTALAAVNAHDAAEQYRMAGDSDKAFIELQPVLKNAFGRTPLIANEAGAIYEDLNNDREADVRYSQADASGDQNLAGYQQHVALLVRMNALDRAGALIVTAENRVGDHQAFLPNLIAIALRRNKADQAIGYVRECMDTENDSLRRQCQYALLNPAEQKKLDDLTPEQRVSMDRALDRSSNKISVTSILGGLAPKKAN